MTNSASEMTASLTELSEVLSKSVRVEANVSIPGQGQVFQAATLYWPADLSALRSEALVCLPGGNMNRRYFDLQPDSGDKSFSFALQFASRGYLVITIDPLGVGESDRPEDSYVLTPSLINQANANVLDRLSHDLREGVISQQLPALPNLQTIGIGHSMGAMFTVLQQYGFKQHAAVGLLGFATDGLPMYLSKEAKELADDPAKIRPQLQRLASTMFGGQHYPDISQGGGGNIYGGRSALRDGVHALANARDRLLPVPAFMSILPDNVGPEARALDVPVLIAMGDRDLVKPRDNPSQEFPASNSVTQIVLDDTGHSPFIFNSRFDLYERLERWLELVSSPLQ